MNTRIAPIERRLRCDVLGKVDEEAIHETVLTVLEDVGVSFPNAKALRILAAGGCRVDQARQVARLPRAVVLAALAGAPKQFILAGRDVACDVALDGRHCYLSNDGCGLYVLDADTGERRPSTKQDVADSARLVDALANVSFYWGPLVTAEDRPQATKCLHELEAIFLNTSKHVQAVDVVGGRPARLAIEMAAALAGGYEELRRRPLLSFIACPVDPLGNEGASLEVGLAAAKFGLPCGFLSMTMGCGTAPATIAGNLVVNLAAVLADTVLLQLAAPGTPVFFAGAPTVMNLRSGGYASGNPEDHLLAAGAVQMAHFYGLPVAVGTMGSGAKDPGWQTGVEDSLSTLASVLSGADMMNGCGLLYGSRIASFAHLVMDSEIYSVAARVAAGIDVSDETLALETIRKVGPNGTYLAEKHTRRHMREMWQPTVYDRSSFDAWQRAGRRGALERAGEIAASLLRTQEPAPLPAGAAAELAAIVARAEAVA
jgi:trimethylamine--corrinoid protein Co-methyltransferase